MQVVHVVTGGEVQVVQEACCVVVIDLQELQKEEAVYGEEGVCGVNAGMAGRGQEQTA